MKNIKLISLLIGLSLVPLVSNVLPPNTINSVKIEFVSLIKTPLKLTNSLSNSLSGVFEFRNLQSENRILKKKTEELTLQLINYREAYIENRRLKELLVFKKGLTYRSICAQVIGKDVSSFSSSLLINKGLDEGIKLDMPVVTNLGLVGRVSEVGRHMSRIVLITDPNLKVSAIAQTTRDEGVIEGYTKGLCRMKYIDVNAKLLKNDIVLTLGEGRLFPKGFPIGTIVAYKKDFNRLYHIATVKPFADFSKLEEVFCLEVD